MENWNSDLALEHHGILGMKWGVRKYQNKDGTLTTAGRIHYNKGDGTRNTTTKKEYDPPESILRKRAKAQVIQNDKNRRILSDAELQQRLNRLRNEKQYHDLTADEINPGRKYAVSILKDIGKKTLVGIGTGVLLWGAKQAGASILADTGWKDMTKVLK